MQKVKSNIKYALCTINVIISIFSVVIIVNTLQSPSVVTDLAVGALFIGVLNVFIISFLSLLCKLRESKYLDLITSAYQKYSDLQIVYTLVQVVCISLIYTACMFNIA